jgi:hypothetical protein
MRKVCLVLLCGFAAVPAALAATGASNDGALELNKVNAFSLTITASRGTLWGQMDRGKLIVTDPVLGDGKILVSGADKAPKIIPVDNGTVTVWQGTDIHFRVTGGRYKLVFKPLTTNDTAAKGIDLTAVGVGVADLTGDVFAAKTGEYSVDGGDWTTVPFVHRQIQFGTPATTTTTTP